MYASKSKVVCTAFEEAHRYLNAECCLTGNPIRTDIINGKRDEGGRKFQLDPNKNTLFVLAVAKDPFFKSSNRRFH